jgi:hypothetical protein
LVELDLPLMLSRRKKILALTCSISSFIFVIHFVLMITLPYTEVFNRILEVSGIIVVLIVFSGLTGTFIAPVGMAIYKFKGKPFSAWVFIGPTILFVTFIFMFVKQLIGPPSLPRGSYQEEFNSEIWSSKTSKNLKNKITDREKMLGSVVEELLPGKTRLEIEAMLGASDKETRFVKLKPDLIYSLGPKSNSFIPLDSEWLLIWLDSLGNYKSYKIAID